jgi:hypothetical protein
MVRRHHSTPLVGNQSHKLLLAKRHEDESLPQEEIATKNREDSHLKERPMGGGDEADF